MSCNHEIKTITEDGQKKSLTIDDLAAWAASQKRELKFLKSLLPKIKIRQIINIERMRQ